VKRSEQWDKMAKFVIDEDMPRSTGKVLKGVGHDVKDIRDCGLRGARDEQIYDFLKKKKQLFLQEIRVLAIFYGFHWVNILGLSLHTSLMKCPPRR